MDTLFNRSRIEVRKNWADMIIFSGFLKSFDIVIRHGISNSELDIGPVTGVSFHKKDFGVWMFLMC